MKPAAACFAAAALAAALVSAQTGEVTFRSDVRLVEVYATVFDRGGKHLDGLTRERFQVTDNGKPQTIATFETNTADLSCALLLDTTGSMARALPVVKNAVIKLVEQLRETDSVAVYGFSTTLRVLQDFTVEKALVKKAVLGARPSGRTALFDSISQVAREIARRGGKKVIVAFTDGADNASVLAASSAMARARKIGVPVYTVAQGEALQNRELVRQLKEIARHTGGQSYSVSSSREIDEVFQDIAADLRHTYMLSYKAPPSADRKWRAVQVDISGGQGFRIRAKQGYFPE